MSESQKNEEIFEFEEKIKKKYSNITKIIFLIGVIYAESFIGYSKKNKSQNIILFYN